MATQHNFRIKNGLEVAGTERISSSGAITPQSLTVTADAGIGGNLTVTGNFVVNGTTTTLNTAALNVEDLNITVAKGAGNSAAADGAGLTIDGAGASMIWDDGNQYFEFNKALFSSLGYFVGTTSTKVGHLQNSAGVFHMEAATTRQIAFGNATNGEHVRIDATGNVGIGTGANVDELLHIEKSSGATLVKTEVAANSVVGFEIQKTGSTTSNWRIVDGQTVNGNLEIYDVTDSRSVMMIDGDGDIGMGVSPATHAKLTLGGTATSYSSVLAFDNNTTGGASFFMLASDNTWSAGGNNFFMGHGSPSSAAVDLTIDADGNVGIGTTSPSTPLHVRNVGNPNGGNRNTVETVLTLDTTGHYPYNGYGIGIDLKGEDYGNTAIREYGKIQAVMTDHSDQNASGDPSFKSALTFWTNTGGASNTAATEKMRIDSNGKVGIGTTSPSAPLHIQTEDGTTNSAVNSLMITNLSTGTTTTGFGGEIRFQAERNNGVNQNTGGIRSIAEVNSGTNISSGMAFDTSLAGVNYETLRLTKDGNALLRGGKSSDEVYMDIFSDSGSNRGAGYFRFKTDGASAEESVAQIYMEQGAGDGGSRKCNMYFQVSDNGSPSTAMQIENNKVITTYGDFKPGHDVIMNNGRGISFAATSNASTSGTAMGSENLDDYEEGTWSPQIIAGITNPTGGSNLGQNGHYVKIGRQVWVSFYVGVSWNNSPSGGIYVNRLPFTIANNSNNESHPPVTTYNFGTGTGESPFLVPQLGTTNARLYMMGPGAWGAGAFQSHVSSPHYITGQFTYFTT